MLEQLATMSGQDLINFMKESGQLPDSPVIKTDIVPSFNYEVTISFEDMEMNGARVEHYYLERRTNGKLC